MSTTFIPPKPDQWQGPADSGGFTPPPINSWEGLGSSTADFHLGRFLSTIASDVMGAPKKAMDWLTSDDPIGAASDTLREFTQARQQQQAAAVQAYHQGDYKGAALHGLFGVPFVGPIGASLYEEAKTDPSAAMAHTAEALAPFGGKALDLLSQGADAISPTVSKLWRANPRVYSAQLFPKAGAAPLIPRLGEAFEDLKQFGGAPDTTILGNDKVGVEHLAPSELVQKGPSLTETAADNLEEQGLAPWMDRARVNGWTVPGDDIVQGRINAIPTMMWREDPKGAMALVKEAQDAYGDKQLTVDEAKELLEEKNKGSAPFQRQTVSRQGTSEVGATPPAIESADAGAVRNALYQTLDPENEGAGPRQIQRRIGNQLQLKDAAEGEVGNITAEHAGTVLGGFVKPVGNLLAAMKFGRPMKFFETLGHPWDGPSDAMITKLYREAGPAAPLPKPPPFRAQVSPAGLLDAPPARLGGAMGTQYDPMMGERPTSTAAGMPPEWHQNVWQGAGAPRQLPPGSAPFTRGTSVPDTTVVPGEMPRGTPYTEVPAGPSRQLPPAGFNTPGAPIAMPPSGGYPSGSLREGQPEFLRRGAVIRPMEPERGPYPASQLGPEPPPQEAPTPINRQEAGPGYGSSVFPKEKVAEFAKMNDLTPEKALAELAKEGYVVK